LALSLTAIGFGHTEQGMLGVRTRAEILVLTPDCVDNQFAGICSLFVEMVLSDADVFSQHDSCEDSGGPELLTLPDTDPDAGLVIFVAGTSRAAPDLPQDPTHQYRGSGVYTHVGRQSIGVPKPRTAARTRSQ
jgi:hypothetical protein